MCSNRKRSTQHKRKHKICVSSGYAWREHKREQAEICPVTWKWAKLMRAQQNRCSKSKATLWRRCLFVSRFQDSLPTLQGRTNPRSGWQARFVLLRQRVSRWVRSARRPRSSRTSLVKPNQMRWSWRRNCRSFDSTKVMYRSIPNSPKSDTRSSLSRNWGIVYCWHFSRYFCHK